jgi:hypothetical protein
MRDTDHRAALATIKTVPQLIAYLRDEMGNWCQVSGVGGGLNTSTVGWKDAGMMASDGANYMLRGAAMAKAYDVLFLGKPATNWEKEAFPLGNGRLG